MFEDPLPLIVGGNVTVRAGDGTNSVTFDGASGSTVGGTVHETATIALPVTAGVTLLRRSPPWRADGQCHERPSCGRGR